MESRSEVLVVMLAVKTLTAGRFEGGDEGQLDGSPEGSEKLGCPHYEIIQAFFKAARENGLDTSKAARDRCRGAMGVYLGKRIESRSELSSAEWRNAITGVKAGVLFW